MSRNINFFVIRNKKKIDKETLAIYTSYLRRLRKKLHLNQIDVARGICTVSYYSRIENNQVECEVSIIEAFFKNMNVDFNELRENHNDKIFSEIIILMLKNEEDKLIQLIDSLLNNEFYTEEEKALFSILKEDVVNNLKKANSLYIKFVDNPVPLSKIEKSFLDYSRALYYFKIKDFDAALEKSLLILSDEIDESVKNAVYSLILDICENTNDAGRFFKYYDKINNSEFMSNYPKRGLRHRAQKYFFEFNIDVVDDLNDELQKLERQAISLEEMNYLYWLEYKACFKNENYQRCIELINQYNEITGDWAIALGYLCIYTNDKELTQKYIKLMNNYTFNNENRLYFDVCNAVKLYLQDDSLAAINILKDVLNNKYYQKLDMFINILNVKLFLELSNKVGRYKDAVLIVKSLLSFNTKFTF